MAGDEKAGVYVLGEITVKGELIRPTKQTGDSLYTGSSVTRKGIELLGTPAETSIYNALNILPGINVESFDPYGLSSSYSRVRGLKDMYIGMTVEGIPNYGIMPIGAREHIYDTENIESVSLYKGASPADLGTGSGNRGGAIELQMRRPENKIGAEIIQSFGSDDFMRSFLRIDSGKLPTETKLFASYSYSQADKWKGKGDLGPRDHVTLGLNQEFGKKVNLDIFFNFNEIERHTFQSLTYDEARHIDTNYDNSFSSNATNTNYYDYNREKLINRDLMSIIDIDISENTHLSFKPYLSNESASHMGKAQFPVSGVKTPGILDKITDLERYGLIPEVNVDISDFELTVGYWFESHNLEKYVKRYITPGNGLEYNGYLYYSENEGHGEIHSPYAKVSYESEKFRFQAGLKYFYYEEPASTGYTTTDATTLALEEDPDISLKATDYDEFLPTVGLGYQFNENIEMYVNYGRNYMRPYAYVPVTTTYVSNKKWFKDAGMTLQDIFDKWEMETSDNIDISFRYHNKYFSIAPVAFYSKHHDLLVKVDDQNVIKTKPDGSSTSVSYHQNVGDATSYGFELEMSFYPLKDLIFYFSPSYTNMSFDDDFRTGNSILKIKGNQLPDT
ncbi:MAG: TonB-dependent receptor, partial [Deltaproteobacteria bacterium]|nr:TonB-dependent receptor [Deltaproteobacteria bacterium]